jgi:hypothetical protein
MNITRRVADGRAAPRKVIGIYLSSPTIATAR